MTDPTLTLSAAPRAEAHGPSGGGADTEPVRRLEWQRAKVVAIEPCTPRVRRYFFELPEPAVFLAGQHMDVRLVAPDGYVAQRSYSIASAPERPERIELAIERLDDGEVSTFFHDVVQVGDEIDLRGPIGGHFVWSVQDGGPLLLVGGGSGVVPLMAMIRHHAAQASTIPATLIMSARTTADLWYLDELRTLQVSDRAFRLVATVSRETPVQPDVRTGRIDRLLVDEALQALGRPHLTYVCGNDPFVETITGVLLDLGLEAGRIRTERYGG